MKNNANTNAGKRQRAVAAVVLTLLACAAMAFIDGVVEPPYAVKSAIKLVLLVILPIAYMLIAGGRAMKNMLDPRKCKRTPMLAALGVGACVYAVIVGGYFALRGVFDFSAIVDSLAAGEGVTRENFPLVALYISVVNSFAEETMFRLFAFGVLRGAGMKKTAYVFSSLAFALYHIAIMSGWFSPLLFALLLAGLFAGGLIFDFADDKADSVYPSWIIHMCANLGTNTVGLVLFSIL